jgi:hypothetical protein
MIHADVEKERAHERAEEVDTVANVALGIVSELGHTAASAST